MIKSPGTKRVHLDDDDVVDIEGANMSACLETGTQAHLTQRYRDRKMQRYRDRLIL